MIEKYNVYISKIVENTIVDGYGLRTSVYVSGCDIQCLDCHNKSLWALDSGTKVSIETLYEKLTSSFTNITFIGGEPMMQSLPLSILAKQIKETTNKTIWLYSGHTYETILKNKTYFELLKYCDILVDGKFDKNFFKNNLKFRGSENQRIIDIKKSLSSNNIILWEDEFLSQTI